MRHKVEAIERRLAAISGVGTGTTVGSDAQDAYRAAIKGLKDAQKKLTNDLAAKAADDVLVADRVAVQVAQAQVDSAMSALARENEQYSNATAAVPAATDSRAPAAVAAGVRTTPRVLPASHSIDTYT